MTKMTTTMTSDSLFPHRICVKWGGVFPLGFVTGVGIAIAISTVIAIAISILVILPFKKKKVFLDI